MNSRYAAIGCLAFAVLAMLVRVPAVQNLDVHALLAIHAHSSPGFDEFMLNVNAIAGPKPVYAVTVLIALWLASRRRWIACASVMLSMSVSGLLNLALRELFHRHRPELWHTLIYDHSFIWSFPSGHACLASSAATMIALLSRSSRHRKAALAFGIVYSLVVASTTLALGVHYPIDILAGWISGCLCVSAIWALVARLSASRAAQLQSAEQPEPT